VRGLTNFPLRQLAKMPQLFRDLLHPGFRRRCRKHRAFDVRRGYRSLQQKAWRGQLQQRRPGASEIVA